MRNLFEKTIERQAVRLSSIAPVTEQMLEAIEVYDLEDCKSVEPCGVRL